MPIEKWIFLIHLFATAMMVAVIWFVQIVHYPLFEAVGKAAFRAYEQSHQWRITLIVAPLMLIEIMTALLLWFMRPQGLPDSAVLVGLFLILVIWMSTVFVQVPIHNQLSKEGYSAELIASLVNGNWIRTVSWTIRGVLVGWLLLGQLESSS